MTHPFVFLVTLIIKILHLCVYIHIVQCIIVLNSYNEDKKIFQCLLFLLHGLLSSQERMEEQKREAPNCYSKPERKNRSHHLISIKNTERSEIILAATTEPCSKSETCVFILFYLKITFCF